MKVLWSCPDCIFCLWLLAGTLKFAKDSTETSYSPVPPVSRESTRTKSTTEICLKVVIWSFSVLNWNFWHGLRLAAALVKMQSSKRSNSCPKQWLSSYNFSTRSFFWNLLAPSLFFLNTWNFKPLVTCCHWGSSVGGIAYYIKGNYLNRGDDDWQCFHAN